jgi:hypothetical protein
MQTARRRRAAVELLESRWLLSGAGGGTVANPLTLSGTVHGTYHVHGGVSTTQATGSISPLGHVSDKGSSTLTSGSETISAKQGKLFISLDVKQILGGFSGTYKLTGGTKSLAGETGSGHVQVSVDGSLIKGSYTTTYS